TQLTETLRRHLDLSRDQAKKRAVELLQEVHIPDAARRLSDYPHRFSGGMRQRVMIAIAIACNPKLLLADEPTTALDVTVQHGVPDPLDDLAREPTLATLTSTHNRAAFAERADDIVVMYPGEGVHQPNGVYLSGRPDLPYTEALPASLPHREGGDVRHNRLIS